MPKHEIDVSTYTELHKSKPSGFKMWLFFLYIGDEVMCKFSTEADYALAEQSALRVRKHGQYDKVVLHSWMQKS